jgi:hypothetical protein
MRVISAVTQLCFAIIAYLVMSLWVATFVSLITPKDTIANWLDFVSPLW